MPRPTMAVILSFLTLIGPSWAQQSLAKLEEHKRTGTIQPIVLKPARVWDGNAVAVHDGWLVVIRGEIIDAVGPPGEIKIPEDARTIDLPGATLLPGLIDAHTHVLLHPYDEAVWDDQVLKEALALRVLSCDQPSQKHLTFRLHNNPGPGYRGGRVC